MLGIDIRYYIGVMGINWENLDTKYNITYENLKNIIFRMSTVNL